MSLPDALEAAASALPDDADVIRPANGDPFRLLDTLSPEAAVRVLGWLLEERPAEGEELAIDWESDEKGAALLANLDEKAFSKVGRKTLRKVKHRLRSRGVAVAEEAAAPKVAALGTTDEDLHGAWLTGIDPSGARMAVLVEPNPGRGARLFEIILDDARGIASFEVYAASRGKVKRFVKSLTERGPQRGIAVDEAVLQVVVARALAAQPKDRGLPRGFGEWRTRLCGAPEGTKAPGEIVAEALGAGDATAEAAIALVEERRVGPWPAAQEDLAALFEKVREAFESPLVVSGQAKRDQIDGVLAEGAAELYAGEAGEIAARRFRESAFVFWKHDDEETARACLAGAAAFEAGGSDENPVAVAMLRATLGPALAQLEASDAAEGEPESASGEEEGESLIVTP